MIVAEGDKGLTKLPVHDLAIRSRDILKLQTVERNHRVFGPQTKLITILGFDVKLDFSWIFIATLVVWSLATGYFPDQLEDLSRDTYWAMAIIAMAGLFFSIVFHELAHSLVARIFGLEIKGITLFIFRMGHNFLIQFPAKIQVSRRVRHRQSPPASNGHGF